MDREIYSSRLVLHYSTANLNFSLECFGDHLAAEQSYPQGINGFEAIYLYLCRKYGWTINQCRAMKKSDIRLVLATEMKDWTLPEDAVSGSPSPEAGGS
ncbi:hypothetical protein HL273_08900 [Yersinia enterocolitica]|uniref:hypothetical protein n=1 Tax=Yersinia enterocolitica TaxID=630 RepID=UPI00155AEB78|nr:hypothetical protein [Yersinia enterocolitica]MBX9485805.1 hypothetical protein [Yersinia enterocolitica]NQS96734.1 hypothetical protein [Yersinia enterocolitica]NQT43411.1 hypothetical protein [Yersinia enterocolitica]NQT98789.1 hypothetical protein [Yersinia enterocolitica]HDL8115259.1 hypothetical protein [Yersinia enterocolitica]